MAEKIMIKGARLSFPSLFHKSEFEGKEGKFEATLLIPKSDTKTYNQIVKAIEAAKKEANKKVVEKNYFIKDGDEIYEEKEYDGYEGHWAIKAANSKRPTVIDRDKTPLTEDDERVYAGCYVNAIISPWVQDNQYGKRVNANLLGIQFVKDGEAFGDATVADVDDFDDVEDDDFDGEEDL